MAGEVPPDLMPLSQLSGNSRLPTLPELKAVLDVQHFVRCFEQIYRSDRFDPQEPKQPLFAGEDRFFQNRFSRAVYLLLLAGAVFSRVYHEPLALASQDGPRDLLANFFRQEALRYVPPEWTAQHPEILQLQKFRPCDMEYLERFAPYRFLLDGHNEERVAFGPFADWLAKEAERLEGREIRQIGSRHPDVEWGVLREILAVLYVNEQLCMQMEKLTSLTNLDLDGFHKPSGRKVSLIRWGTFQPESIRTPKTVADSPDSFFTLCLPDLDSEQLPIVIGGRGDTPHLPLYIVDMRRLLSMMYKASGRPNQRDGWPAPLPRLQIFEFLLRELCGRQFHSDAFGYLPDIGYADFISAPFETLLFYDDNGDGFTVPCKPVRRSYQEGFLG